MAGIGSLVATLGLDSSGFKKGTKGAQSSLLSFAKGIAGPVAVAAGALATLWGGSKAVAGFKAQLDAERKLNAVLKATGGAAELSAKEIKTFASGLQDVTNFGDEATIEAASLLATFKNIKGDVFKDAIVSMQDMATVMGTDVSAGAVQMGKALNDPIKGAAALADVGVGFTEQQKEQIRVMQEAGDMAGAQGVILAELEGQFGGAAQALASPWVQMTNVLGDIGEMIGSVISPALNVVATIIKDNTAWVTEFAEEFKAAGVTIASYVVVVSDVLFELAGTFYDVIQPAVNATIEWFTGLFNQVIGGTGTFEDMAIDAIVSLKNIGGILMVSAAEWELWFVGIGNDAVFVFTDQIPAAVAWFADNIQDIVFTATDYILTTFINLGKNIRNIWQAVLDFFTTGEINFDWTPLMEGAVSTIKQMPEMPDRVATEFEQALSSDIELMNKQLSEKMTADREELVNTLQQTRDKIEASLSTDGPAQVGSGGTGEDDGSKKKAGETRFAGGLERGSADAFSAIVKNMQNSPELKVQQEQAKTLKTIAENTKPQPGGAFAIQGAV